MVVGIGPLSQSLLLFRRLLAKLLSTQVQKLSPINKANDCNDGIIKTSHHFPRSLFFFFFFFKNHVQLVPIKLSKTANDHAYRIWKFFLFNLIISCYPRSRINKWDKRKEERKDRNQRSIYPNLVLGRKVGNFEMWLVHRMAINRPLIAPKHRFLAEKSSPLSFPPHPLGE